VTTVDLPYGRERLVVRLPARCQATIVAKPPMPTAADPQAAVEAAFDEPVGTDRLEALAGDCSSACIALCDITRPVPNQLFLRSLLDRLHAGGISSDRTTILIATGLHRPCVDDEIAEIVGDPLLHHSVRILNHHARVDAEHTEIGHTSRGTPIRIDKRFVEADLRIVTGLVEPHFMAGYSGGRKLVAPGLAHAETITTLHNHEFMAHPLAASCVTVGNPLHEELTEIANLVGDIVAVNTVIDESRRLAFINFGEVHQSHADAVAFARRWSEVPVPRRFKTVLTSGGGHPLDATYYQTVKGMVGAADLVENGGDILIASACTEGIGSPSFASAQTRLLDLGVDGFLGDISRKKRADVDEWQTQMQLRAQAQAHIGLYSGGLDDEARAITGVETVESLERAIAASAERHGDERIAVVPEGPYVVPRIV